MAEKHTHNPSVEHHAASTPPQPSLPQSRPLPEGEAERTGATPEMHDQDDEAKGHPHSDREKMERAYIDQHGTDNNKT